MTLVGSARKETSIVMECDGVMELRLTWLRRKHRLSLSADFPDWVEAGTGSFVRFII